VSILTKVCVVVLVIVALLACPVFVKQATVIPYYKGMFEMEQRRSALLLQDRQNINLAYEEAVRQRDAARRDYNSVHADMIKSNAKLRDDISKLELDKTELVASKARLEAENTSLVALHKDDQKRVDEALALNVKYRDKIEALAAGKARVEDLLAEARAGLRKAQDLAKVYREREAIAVRDAEEIREKLAKYIEKYGDLKAGTGQPRDVQIRATILAVKEGIASINAGSAKGVRPGARLVVYRGDRFVGYLKVIEVEAQESAGLMVDAVLTAQQGDKVTSEDTVRGATAGG